MSPREDVALFEAERSISTAKSLQVASPSVLSRDAITEALSGLRQARKDLDWNVYPTDTSLVYLRVSNFVDKLRQFISLLGNGENSSQFKDDSLLMEAHKTAEVLGRHLKLTTVYDDSEAQRLMRPIVEQDAELEVLEKRGKAAKEAVYTLLRKTEQYLESLT